MSEGETRETRPQPRIGSYQILHSLGSGGMSSVFKAVHVETGHEVAVKVLPRALAKNVTLLQRFLREAKSAEALEHPNIVSIYDRGVDQGRHYLVLEYVDGGDLHDRVRTEGPLGIGEAVAVIRSVCKGLEFAASRGLIHRDIKPANLLRTPDGRVKIIDLGLALQSENEDERVTREGTTVGTVDYMSPEQARDSRATSEQSDIYSLGCTFYFLLTGAPPFPGGDVADKLSRHCVQPPPDARKLRPEIPGPLALLIRRMMAKRPENRFASYQDLIEELDAVPTGAEKPAAASTVEAPTTDAPLYAIFDEDEGEPDLTAPAPLPEPLFALLDDEEPTNETPAPLPSTEPQPLYALLDEDDSGNGDALPPSPTVSRPKKRELRTFNDDRDPTPSLRDVSMAELASLAEDVPAAVPTRKTPAAATRNGPVPAPDRLEAMLGEDHSAEVMHEGVMLAGGRKSADPTKRIVMTYSLVGIALVLLVIGTHQLIRSASSQSELELPSETGDVTAPPPEPVEPSMPPAVAIVTQNQAPGKVESRRPVTKQPVAETQSPVPSWVEPTDPSPVVVQNAELDAAPEEEITPKWAAWATAPIPVRLDSPQFARVQRAFDPRDPAQKPSLRLAELRGGTIEVADNGPFFEDDPSIYGLVRALPGFRPIVCIEGSKHNKPAGFVLDGKNLTLDGIDLVIDVAALPLNQTALFQCRGGTLTLRECTITIVNPRGKSFAVVRTVEPTRRDEASRIRFERTLVRGKGYTAFELGGGTSEVVLNESVLVAGKGSMFGCSMSEPNVSRKIHIVRSLIGARGSLLELGSTSIVKPSRVAFSAMASTFASLDGASSLVSLADDVRPADLIDWKGDFNRFVGWRDRVSAGPGHLVKIANLAASQAAWRGTERRSREIPAPWKVTADLERVRPDELMSCPKEARATVTKVPTPNSELLKQTVISFGPQLIPRLAPSAPIAQASPASSAPPGNGADQPIAAPVVRELHFNLDDSAWQGDLGQYLSKHARPGDRVIRILVSGGGKEHKTTPVRLPDGVSVHVLPDPSRPTNLEPIAWSPHKGEPGEALLELHGGDLVLSHVKLTRDATTRPRRLILVEGGHLVLDRCWLSAPGSVEGEGGDLIEFRAPTTQPFNHGTAPFQTPCDRPTCFLLDTILITGGNAIRTELGRGTVALSNCVVAAGRNVFVLEPAQVARSRFEATLLLDHCNIAAEQSFVLLKKWLGSSAGPDRPWLVCSVGTAFLANYKRPSEPPEGVLLRVEPDSLSHGALFWEGANDAYEVKHFLALAGSPLDPRKPDVEILWEKLWGHRHMHNVTGPSLTRGSAASATSVHPKAPLKPGQVRVEDLELNPSRVRQNVGADFQRLLSRPRTGAPPR